MAKWLIDFDSTLSNTFDAQLDAVNKRFGTNYSRESFTTWLTEDMMDPEHAEYMWGRDLFLNYDFQLSVEPVEGAIETVRDMMKRGEQIYIVSDRPSSLWIATRHWLRKHLLYVPLELTHNKYSKSVPTRGGRTKAQVAWQNRLTHVVEDAPHHAEGFANRHFIEKVYLLDYPHNRETQHEKIERVSSWKEIA